MFRRNSLINLILVGFSLALFAQQKPQPAISSAQEFPLVLEKSVSAGKTPTGAKIQAKLSMATLVHGKVVPRNAVFSGEVIESVAKTKSEPARLGIRMDVVSWKDGTEQVNLYLTSWYYPSISEPLGENLHYGPNQPNRTTWDGAGQSPVENTSVYHPLPGNDSNKGPNMPGTAAPAISSHRVQMKDVETEQGEKALILLSKRRNIKLDHYTSYAFVTGGAVISTR
jgi:hypothetical protein